MYGTIIGFDPDSNTGAIGGDDGRRYDFVRLEWRGAGSPHRGMAVDFLAIGSEARQIYPAAPQFDPAEGDSAKLVYFLYLASLVVGITALIGLVIAYVNRNAAPSWVQTHYRFQIRTFWIGMLYLFISAVTIFAIIGFAFGLLTLVWWIVRSAKGLQRLTHGQPYDNAATWLW